MGKSSHTVIGYWYHPAFHMGLGYGPADALLEIRGGDKTAWSGELTASGTISINKPGLFGGEKDQGGIAGDMDVMFGEATQAPNAYLTSTFGTQQPAWRGCMTVVWKGGRYGAMNPYPQKISYKWRKIIKGWDGDPGDGSACWYAAKAAITLASSASDSSNFLGTIDILGTDALTSPGGPHVITPSGAGWTVHFSRNPAGPYTAYSKWDADVDPTRGDPMGLPWLNTFEVTPAPGTTQEFWPTRYATAVEADAAAQADPVQITGAASYTVWINDTPPGDNRGGLSLAVTETPPGNFAAMNPAHVLYYARTQQHMGREPAANMNDASFRAAADWYYSQGFGLCATYDASQESIDAFIARIEKVAGCSMTRSPADGLWYIDIANGEYDIGSLPVLTDDDILAFTMQAATLDSAINSVSVQYFDPQQKTTVATRPVEALALVSAYGRSHQDTSYPEIPTSGLALRVAQRDLQATATPTHGFEITATRVAHAWRKGTYFRLHAPKHGIADMVCIVGDPDSGTLNSGAIKFTAVEDIYNLPASSFIEQEPGVDTRPPQIPVAIMQQAAFEAPYTSLVPRLSQADLTALPSDVGYLMTVAQAPGDYRSYTITVSTDGGTTYTEEDNAQWTPAAQVTEGDALTGAAPATSFTLANGSLLSSVVAGSAALWQNSDGTYEVCRVDAVDATAMPPTLTLGRGCADSAPVPHAANAAIWFYDGNAAEDTTQYTDGETVDVKLLTNSGSSRLDPAWVFPMSITFAGRLALPYPPATVRIGGAPYPATVTGDIVVTWNRRDRDGQADQMVDSEAADVTPADDVRYSLAFYDDSDTLLVKKDDIAGQTATASLDYTGNVKMVLGAVNDVGDSLQSNVVNFAYTPPGGATESTITAATWTPTEVIFVAGGA